MSSSERGIGRRIAGWALWVLIVLDAASMGLAGFTKFTNTAGWMSMFEGWGYPGWFALVVGGSELTLAMLLLVPRLASYAASGLIVIMIGALATVLVHPGGRMGPDVPVIHLVALSIILAARWRARWRRAGSTVPRDSVT